MVLNRGAVFNYRHSLVDWSTREKTRIYGEKLVAHGHHSNSGSKFAGSVLTRQPAEMTTIGLELL